MKYQKSFSALGAASVGPGLFYDLVNEAPGKHPLRITCLHCFSTNEPLREVLSGLIKRQLWLKVWFLLSER